MASIKELREELAREKKRLSEKHEKKRLTRELKIIKSPTRRAMMQTGRGFKKLSSKALNYLEELRAKEILRQEIASVKSRGRKIAHTKPITIKRKRKSKKRKRRSPIRTKRRSPIRTKRRSSLGGLHSDNGYDFEGIGF